MTVPRPSLVAAALLLCVAAGCGGRSGSWKREKAPTADAGDGVKLCIREYEAKKDEVQVKFEVINDGDDAVSFGIEPFGIGHVVHDSDVENAGATTWLEAGGRRVAFYTVGKTGAYDYGAKVNLYKTLAAGMSSKRISVAPHQLERIALKFMPRPKLDSAKAPLALVVSDVRRGGTALEPLRVEIK